MLTGRFTVVRGLIGSRALSKALKLCKGSYQQDFLLGWESMSGSTLKGKAARYGVKYMHSRCRLLSRMTKAKICFQVETIDRRNCLVFGRRKGKKSVQD